NASIEFAGLLTVTGSFALDQLDVTDTDLTAVVGAGATALALTLTVAASGGGASVSGSLHLLKITNATNPAAVKSWLGVDASDLNFCLEFAPLTLAVTEGALRLNSATGVGVAKLDWAALTYTPADHNGLPFGLNIGPALSLHVEGNASIEFAGLLTVTGSFSLDQLDVTDPDLTAVVGTGATALALTLTAAASGGGASVSGTLHLIKITNASNPAAVKSWLGVDASDLNFCLEFAPLTLAVTEGALRLNSATGVGVAKLDWASLTYTPADHNGLPFGLNIGSALSLHVEGNASIEFAGLLTVTGSFSLDQLDVTDTDLTAVVGTGATALALTLTVAASGGGASVSGTLHLIQITNASNPAAVK